MRVLALDASGTPRDWISLEKAICHYATNEVAWEYGDTRFTARGGHNKDGVQSRIDVASIIAIKSNAGYFRHGKVVLNNNTLFGRDKHTCAYCGRGFASHKLSRDHVIPKSRGGLDVWTNVVTACKDCNCDKDDQLLSECGMELLYLPYTPTHSEKLLLSGRNILEDQMTFLRSRLPKNSRLN
jgi:hypothetical protein